MSQKNKGNVESFSARLQRAMKSKNIDIAELAGKLGISYEVMRRYVAGAHAPRQPARVQAMAVALQVDATWLETGLESEDAGSKVLLIKITDPDIGTTTNVKQPSWIAAPAGFSGIAVQMDLVLNDGFQLGDIVFVRPAHNQLPAAGERVLIEVLKASKSSPRFLFRRTFYGADLAVTYRDEIGSNVLDAKSVKVIGVAEYLLTKLSKN